MIKLIAALMVSVALLSSCEKPAPLTVDESKIELTPEEANYIATHPIVTWALEDNRPPFVFVDKNGNVAGLAPEYLQLISKKTGIVFVPIRTGTYLKSIDEFRGHKVDLLTTVKPSLELAGLMDFTPPIAEFSGVFVFRSNAGPLRSPFTSSLRYGYDTAAKQYLELRFPGMKLVETEDDEQSMVLLQKGLVDGAVLDEGTARYFIETGALNVQTARIGFAFPYSFAYHKDDQLLGDILIKALASISPQDRRVLESRWLVIKNP